ncbi:hypothetical protein AB4259_15820 [Vibrio amylolyticus]|uniref:hypothetical protein n=1 Tax=Vibrio amylolyticus TaxID=2847292 RepID=UPI00354DAC77
MNTPRHKYRLARWSLAIVWWVVFVCVAQNSGIFSVCQLSYNLNGSESLQQSVQPSSQQSAQSTVPASYQGSDLDVTTSQAQHSNLSEECELTKHLLNIHQHQVDDYPLIMFLVALFLLSLTVVGRDSYSSLTEPIVPKRRTHLRLCIFRE